MPLRILFMGTPDFAVPTLRELHRRGHRIAAVYTRVPKPGNRGLQLQPTPLEREADRLELSVVTPKTLKGDEALLAVRAHDAEVAVVVAYGLILPQAILDAFPRGCFNLHASLLPRWRGAAPLTRAVMAGDAESGVTVMKMEAGLDTGPVALEARAPITDRTTAGDLHDRLAVLGAELMAQAMERLEQGTLTLTPQNEAGVTYAAKIDKAETRIDWTRDAHALLRHIHGLSPYPGAWCELPLDGLPVRVKVLRVELAAGSGAPGTVLDDGLAIACGSGALRFVEVQRQGKRAMSASAFLHGASVPAGSRVS
jgi:methionyl-tRNA formyltransferase